MKLPIESIVPEVLDLLAKNSSLILQSPPGSGKTTFIPIQILKESWMKGKKILMLEPRRLAAKNAANRIASLLKEKTGETAGYRMRFDSKIGSDTRIEVVTEGIFIKMIQRDPELKDVGVVIFDEFHERSIDSDFGLALTLYARKLFCPELKVLIMSATIDSKRISNFLDNAPVVTSSGNIFPVDIIYNEKEEIFSTAHILKSVLKALRNKGDILVFLPGSGEIRKLANILREELDKKDILVYTLFGDMDFKEQEKAILPDKNGMRKIILTTNIAESSITIEGVSIVIDSGLAKTPRFNPGTGMTKLETVKIARDSADQRAGRAGRLGPALCYRLWTKREHFELQETTKPEILESELSSLIVDAVSFGTFPEELQWLDPPSPSHLKKSYSLLKNLNIINDRNTVTPIGNILSRFPVHPRLGYMICRAAEFGEEKIACSLAAILSEKDLFRGKIIDSDLELRISVLENKTGLISSNQIEQYSVQRVKMVSDLLLNIVKEAGLKKNKQEDFSPDTGAILAFAYTDNIARLRESSREKYKLSSGKGAYLNQNDSLAGEDFIVVAASDGSEKETKIFLASRIKKESIYKYFPEKIDRKVSITSENNDKIECIELEYLGEIELNRRIIKNPEESLIHKALIDYIQKNGISCFNINDSSVDFQKRVDFLNKSGFSLPDISIDSLIKSLNEWLPPYLRGYSRISDLKKIDFHQVLKSFFNYSQLLVIEKEAPEKIQVPSGSIIKIEYNENRPHISVKLQEVFGWNETPKIAGNKIPITFLLLSPAMRPIQITSDLYSFWKNTYQEVKKELKGRYPKHPWPDDPFSATATRGTKKKNNYS